MKRMRWQAVSAASIVTIADLLLAICSATTSTAIVGLIQAFRIKKVEVWGPVPTPPALSTVTMLWGGAAPDTVGLSMNGKLISDTSMGSTQPPHLKASPDPASWAGDWVATVDSTEPVITFSLPTNSIVDITFEFTLATTRSSPSTRNVTNLNGNAIGDILYGYLATGALMPVGVSTYTP
jgi:hypothetical protein